MKIFLSIGTILTLLVAPSYASAQAGTIGLFSDTQGVDCTIEDTAPGLVAVHAVYIRVAEASAAGFSVQASARFSATWIGDTHPFPVTLFNSQTGIAIGFGGCLSSPILLTTINYFGNGTSATCSMLEVVADTHPNIDEVQGVDCSVPTPLLIFPTGGKAYINSDGSCRCELTIPTEEHSWGSIKSIYEGD